MEENFKILKPLLRGLPIVILIMSLSVLLAKKYLSYVTPMYESTTKLKLADIGEGVPNSNLYKNFDVFANANKIAAEIEVLKSSELLNKTLKSLDFNTEISRVGDFQKVELYKKSPIKIHLLKETGNAYDEKFQLKITSLSDYEIQKETGEILLRGKIDSPEQFLDNKIIISLNQDFINQKKEIKIIDNYEFEFISNEKMVEKISKDLDIVSVDKDVAVIRINLKSNVPQKAFEFVNKLAETYIYDYIENKYQAANTTVNFLDNQIKEATTKLSKSENSIEDYRNVNGITNIKQETETDLRKISQLKIQQTNLKMNLEAIDELNKYIALGKDNFLSLAPNFEAFTDLLSTEIIKNIKKLQADKKDMLLTFTPNDERVLVIDEKIKDLTNYLIESIKNTKNNLQVKYNQITNDINEAELVFVTVPEKEKNLTIMDRDFNLLQESYNFLNKKKIEAEIAQSAKISFHRIITPATIAKKPISPNRPIIIILSAILGMIFSIIAIYIVHFIKAKVNDVETIEKNTTIPIATSTPYLKNNNANYFKKTVLQLELKEILKTNKIVSITSNSNNEGKSFNIINICKTLSNQGKKVLVLDVQSDLLALKKGNKNEINIYNTTLENVSYLNIKSENIFAQSAEQIKEYIQLLKNNFDHILINNEFLKEESNALLMMSISDSNLFIVDARNTPLKTINKIELLKAEYQIENLWFVLNKIGYNPSVIKEIVNYFKKRFKK